VENERRLANEGGNVMEPICAAALNPATDELCFDRTAKIGLARISRMPDLKETVVDTPRWQKKFVAFLERLGGKHQ
jgi:hypothetical protein